MIRTSRYGTGRLRRFVSPGLLLLLFGVRVFSAGAQDYVWLDAECCDRGNFPASTWLHPANQAERDALSGTNLLSSVNPAQSYWAEYDVIIPSDGTYKVYARRDWHYGVFTWRFDTNAWQKAPGNLLLMDTEPYKQFFPMNWVQVGSETLAAGACTFRIEVKASDWPDAPESGYLDKVAIDAFMISKEAFIPRGKLRPDEKYGLAEPGKWSFEPDPDPHTTNAVLDLRHMNEGVAGQSGYVTRSGDKFLLGDGKPVRFWGVTTSVTGPDVETVRAHARFLAKRGVNLVRYHTTVPAMDPADINAIDQAKLAQIHRLIAGMKQEGVYVKLSWFFVLNFTIRGAWGIAGYPTDAGSPFAIHMVDEDLRAAYKQWLTGIFSSTNQYTGLTLAEDPALALVEIQNEDSFFFWTFSPGGWPAAQQQKIDGRFGQYLTAKYGSLAAAVTAWGGAPFNAAISGRDDQPAGRMTVADAWYMTGGFEGSTRDQKRMADQIQFLSELQRGFYAEMRDHLRLTLGCPALIESGNWKTADVRILQDVERYTYTVADVIDAHHYFDTPHLDSTPPDASSYSVQPGDYYKSRSALYEPRSMPAACKQVAGHPGIVSENTWTHPNRFLAEGPLLIAAYSSLQDVDGWIWFATGVARYEDVVSKFPVAVPSLMGQFPGAALMYRRCDVAAAPVVIQDNRTLPAMYAKERSLISETTGFDPNRDDPDDPVFDPGVGSGQIDPLAFLVGKVETAFSATNIADQVNTNLFPHIDLDVKTVTSMPPSGGTNSQLMLDWSNGVFRVDTPRSQSAVGFLGAAGAIELRDVGLSVGNEYGGVLVCSMDEKPIAVSERVLLQMATEHRPYEWRETNAVFVESSATYTGKQITAMGRAPMNVTQVEGAVTFRSRAGQAARVTALDLNGYERSVESGSFSGPDFIVPLPTGTLYAVVYFTYPPAITAEPDDATAVQGRQTRFSVAATGSLPLAYQWRKGGADVSGATSAVFTIASPQPADAGDYSVVVTNAAAAVTSRTAVLTVKLDSDGDGMADDWEMFHFHSLAVSAGLASEDQDSDGFIDWYEHDAGTDPTNAVSALRIVSIAVSPGAGTMVLRWQSASNRLYAIERSTNLVTGLFEKCAAGIGSAPPVNSHTSAQDHAGLSLYRIVLDP